MIHIQGSDKLTCMHWIKKASISHSKSPSGCEKARPPNVVSLQSVDIIISAPPSATATQLNPPSWPIIVCNGRVGGFGGNSSHCILWLVKMGGIDWVAEEGALIKPPRKRGPTLKKLGGSAERQGLYMLQQWCRFSAVIFQSFQPFESYQTSYPALSRPYKKKL